MTADADDLARALAADAPLTWVLTGDSITHGTVHTQGARTYAEHLHEIIRGELGRVHDAVLDTAISGWRITQILDDFDRRVATWRPQVVTLMIGTNDCVEDGGSPAVQPAEFAASLTDFVHRVRALDATPVLLTQPAVDVPNAPERSRIAQFAQAVRDVAVAEQTVLVDIFTRFADLGNGGVPWGLMNDPFHPNATGHAAIALEVATVLGLDPSGSRVLPQLRADVAAGRLDP
ncbi:SGNH/GDSL hydrolase family protein [Microbacterium azadirachtae]|uniref:GDSL-like Lipase/Acylhydrolase n=1 Tax=Microbacterium azadirachtae TaxID=582680 RepID=A0A0F0KP55_9MICO|nr:SGNH/GDSL hydrolase family protein [Microbacterium azadirachtae]KJL21910.1 GDSL-like Lipase/Acylhydrolase [Microbacterium azadirachtae]SDL62405.1 Lysophospholipase L1 [Microbacterium azadirachtae]SEF91271.1 Lysophospholipase L1 [Microbacterium azadirachtae]SEF93306.1 Lysophospholipase L1 [Microbacterium azadirachtae]